METNGAKAVIDVENGPLSRSRVEHRDLSVGGGRGGGRCRCRDGGRDEGGGAMSEVAVAVPVSEATILAVAEPVAVAVG